jgi:hypothetical protein
MDEFHSNQQSPVEDWVQEMNESYAVASMGGKVVVAILEYSHDLKMNSWQYFTFQTFRDLHCNQWVMEGKKKSAKGKTWLTHQDRSENRRVILDATMPCGIEKPGFLNLWSGFNVKLNLAPLGSYEELITFIRHAIASDNEVSFQYIIQWLAYCAQNPDKMPEVALVLRGKQGTGKGLLARLMVSLFGENGLQISTRKHLTGDFNAHLQSVCFLCADEAYFAGDKSDTGNLKAKITEPTMLIEPKGVNAFRAANHMSVMMTTNEDFAVPASKDERRYAVFDTNPDIAKDTAYFTPLYKIVEVEANKAAFLDYLLNLDLTGFNIRNFPITDALRQQYTESLTSMAIWWMSVLSSGRLLLGKWPNIVTVRQIALNWETWAKDNAVSTFDRRRGNDTAIGMFLSGKRGEPKFIGSKIKEGSGYSYKMLDLNVARVAFIKRFDMPADLFGGEYDE